MSSIHFIGIDVSKDWFDVAVAGDPAKPQRYANTPIGFVALTQKLQSLPQALVVLEATGGYETALIAALLTQRIAVHRADPLTAKHFLRSVRRHAKTDALDARALARYAQERQAELPLCQPEDASLTALSVRLSRRADLVAMRAAEQTRLRHPRYQLIKASVEALLDVLSAQIEALDHQIEALIAASPSFSAKLKTMTAVKGVGRHTAFTLLAAMPELGTLTRRQTASLAGCAPHPRDTGITRGYRATTGGRASVKRALFMAAMAARRFNPALKAFYERLTAKGKKPMVALVAVMRKLITILNAKLRDEAYASSW